MADGNMTEQQMAAELAALRAELRDLRIMASPLFPLASRSLRRATYEAERRGLVCVPATYPLTVTPDKVGSNDVSWTLDVPQSEGPFVVTDIITPQRGGNHHIDQAMRLRVNGEWLDDGPVRTWDGVIAPREYCGHLPSAPVCIGPGVGQLGVTLTDPTQTYLLGEGVQLVGVHARAFAGAVGGRTLCVAENMSAAAWIEAVRNGGQRWGMSIEFDESGGSDGDVISDNVVIECIVIAHRVPSTVEPGENAPVDVQVKIGGQYLTPGNFGPMHGATFDDGVDDGGQRAIVMPGLRYPVRSGQEVVIELQYPADDVPHVPLRVTLLGRRGGIVGACW